MRGGFQHAKVVEKIPLFKAKPKSTNNQAHDRKFLIPAFINRNFLEIFNTIVINCVMSSKQCVFPFVCCFNEPC